MLGPRLGFVAAGSCANSRYFWSFLSNLSIVGCVLLSERFWLQFLVWLLLSTQAQHALALVGVNEQ